MKSPINITKSNSPHKSKDNKSRDNSPIKSIKNETETNSTKQINFQCFNDIFSPSYNQSIGSSIMPSLE